jgi:hypothetical protein
MPIFHECAQRSEAWDLLRIGIPTSSCFHMIVKPSGSPSDQFERYAHHLLAERRLQRHEDTYTSPQMEKSAAREPEARSWYELMTDERVNEIGFITTDDGRIGCSPDGLIGDDGLIEIKVPKPSTQIGYLIPPILDVQKSLRVRRRGELQERQVDKKYKPQIQGQLWVSGRQWVDVLAYSEEHPKIPHQIVRVERDEKFIKILDRRITHFADELDRVEKLIDSVTRGVPRAELEKLMLPKAELREMLNRSLEAL